MIERSIKQYMSYETNVTCTLECSAFNLIWPVVTLGSLTFYSCLCFCGESLDVGNANEPGLSYSQCEQWLILSNPICIDASISLARTVPMLFPVASSALPASDTTFSAWGGRTVRMRKGGAKTAHKLRTERIVVTLGRRPRRYFK